MTNPQPDAAWVDRCQTILAHAWMVRTFIKHSSEVEEFPELMGIARNVFDLCRSVESRVEDPPAYLHQLRKKMSKLRAATVQFAHDAPLASDHTNFRQAVISMEGCVRQLDELLQQFPPPKPPATPFPLAGRSGNLPPLPQQAPSGPTGPAITSGSTGPAKTSGATGQADVAHDTPADSD